jgi:cytochrome c556
MQRFATCVVAVLVSCGAAVAVAQKATTAAELDAAMKRIGPAQGAIGKAIQSGAFADAKTNVATIKQALQDAENFWVVNKRDDAVKMSQDAIARVTAVETALSAAAPDPQAVLAALKQVGATCAACHKAYRVQDENKQYTLKLQ